MAASRAPGSTLGNISFLFSYSSNFGAQCNHSPLLFFFLQMSRGGADCAWFFGIKAQEEMHEL
jgi:hypothetical protein